ncbi:hypothetical protein ILUMI_20211 [Ignelater luminosus]|uniref:Uncharacterized protein n=1 Tax=Ignelater luminosus TaxID=2038154 RepID=A0A8K0CGT0_IGNLU|nr:hypothetical protein ILUMI_20211 [Ignelater luminosus]
MERFSKLERKLLKSPKLCSEYVNFMREYINLGHMTKLTTSAEKYSETVNSNIQLLDSTVSLHNILPHYAVINAGFFTAKLRVVFYYKLSDRTTIPGMEFCAALLLAQLMQKLKASELADNPLWWYGPPFLQLTSDQWPGQLKLRDTPCSEPNTSLQPACNFLQHPDLSLLRKIFISNNAEAKCMIAKKTTELQTALSVLIKLCQSEEFSQEVKDINLLQQPSVRQMYESRLNNLFNKRRVNKDIETEYNSIKQAVQDAAYEALSYIEGKEKSQSPVLFTEEIERLVKEKHETQRSD